VAGADGAVALAHGHATGGLESTLVISLLWLWTTALALDEWFKYAQEPATFSADFWNKYDYTTIGLTFTALVLRLLSVNVAVEVLAFSVLLIWCRLFKYLQLSQTIGLLVIMIQEMFNDIALWVLVSIVFLGAFTVSFVAISDPHAVEHSEFDHPLTTPVWAMLGTFDVAEVHSWNTQIGQVMLYTYLVISQIVLVNLLIAMMGYTFGAIKDNSEEEWKFVRLRSVLEAAERMSPVPPPFNLPQTLLRALRSLVWARLPQACREQLGRCVESLGGSRGFSPIDDECSREAGMAAAKRAKQKVAKRLLLKLKKSEEEGEASVKRNEVALGRLLELVRSQQATLDKLVGAAWLGGVVTSTATRSAEVRESVSKSARGVS